jgi:acetolactate synthase small subunit
MAVATCVAPRAAPGSAQHWVVDVRDSPDALMRVLTTLRRRGCLIDSVEYRRGDRHRSGTLVVRLQPPRHHGHCVQPWIEGLVDVTGVRHYAAS